MSTLKLKIFAAAIVAPCLALAIPVAAVDISPAVPAATSIAFQAPMHADVTVEHKRKKHRHGQYREGNRYRDNDYRDDYRGRDNYRQDYRQDYRQQDYRQQSNYGDPVYQNTRIWRGNDGRYYCRKENGTTGLLIGAAVGGLIGNEVAGRGDRTLGAILGAAGGAILGRAIDRSNSRCR